MRYEYVDVTARTEIEAPHPEVVAAFEVLDFRSAGKYVLDLPDREVGRIVAGYAEPACSVLAAHLPDVATVLLSPDGSTAAFVSWFWDGAAVRLASLLSGGELVETNRLWTERPPWPRALRSGWSRMDLREEVERSSAPGRGRSVRAVAMDDPSDPESVEAFVDEHRRHVEGYAGRRDVSSRPRPAGQVPGPVDTTPLTSIEDAIALRRRAFDHDIGVRRRVVVAFLAAVLAASVVLGLVAGLTPISGLGLIGSLPIVLFFVFGGLWALQGRLLRRLSYVRWIRPRFE